MVFHKRSAPSESREVVKKPRVQTLHGIDAADIAAGAVNLNLSDLSEFGENHAAWLQWSNAKTGARIASYNCGDGEVCRVSYDATPERGPARTQLSIRFTGDLAKFQAINKLILGLKDMPQFRGVTDVIPPFRIDEENGAAYLNTNVYEASSRSPLVCRAANKRPLQLQCLNLGDRVTVERATLACATVYEREEDGATVMSVRCNPKLLQVLAVSDEEIATQKELSKAAKAKSTSVPISKLLGQ